MKSREEVIENIIKFCKDHKVKISAIEGLAIDFLDRHESAILPEFNYISQNTKPESLEGEY